MSAKKISDQEFIDLWNEHQSITKIAAVTGMDLRGLKRRRNSLEIAKNIKLRQIHIDAHAIERKIDLGIKNGTVIVFSDAHFWPFTVNGAEGTSPQCLGTCHNIDSNSLTPWCRINP